MPKYCSKHPKTAQVARTRPGRATWLPGHLCGSEWVGRATWVWFRETFVQRSFAFFLAFLALLSAKCCLSFRFFNKVPENIERCYMSKKCAKGGRLDSSLTRLNKKTQEKMSQIGVKDGTK